ncbi:NO-inducible flavohemoprotein [Marinobacter nanhaiticus D15-8W]|uniref:Flavohemoprotein n=1 Tax=Marinobacter nanhaiticus D15-8W TaxID=626887 RepID=N6W8E4_9GAMM|nr:NO-inducible flavohemoprotein [Marinobacter nanhaiticus]ENO16544.1 NO-inducible flavohemoprotein [Marinobacter nanhaiticus D15-8W]BES72335.1 NO-inducible flavohemoprotein [Marinobacter nanhaiticus D15-8W]
MLRQDTVAIVKQTIPVLQEHGETLTRHFYQRMFQQNPEVKPFFNPAHQKAGTQQRALAGAICAYAQHIDNPAALGDAVEQIAQKHVSLGIRPEHYPIVGENLLASIREVLGEAATDDIIDAWAEAYGVLADIFIQREGEVFQQQEDTYGWQGFKTFVVEKRERCSENIESFYLCPADGTELALHQAGQYITVRIPLPDGSTTMRNYSLSNMPGEPWFRISVKHERGSVEGTPDGVVSGYLHEKLKVGESVEVAPPSGEFTLTLPQEPEKPLVFIAGGVGITPLMSMLQVALDESPADRPIVFIQAAIDGAVQPFAEELETLNRRYDNLALHVRFSDPGADDLAVGRCQSSGIVDAALLEELVGDTPASYYFCGPTPMLRHVRQLLKARGVADRDQHFEFFGPAQAID